MKGNNSQNNNKVIGGTVNNDFEKGIKNYNEISEDTMHVDDYDPNNSVRHQGVQGD